MTEGTAENLKTEEWPDANPRRIIRCGADALDNRGRKDAILALPDEGPSHPLKWRQRPNVPGTVYFVGGKKGPVKIGFSTDVRKRLVKLQAGSPVKLYLLAAWENRDKADEGLLQRRFYVDRLHGEWFKRSPEIEAEIARLNSVYSEVWHG